jgi:hypothetical protein
MMTYQDEKQFRQRAVPLRIPRLRETKVGNADPRRVPGRGASLSRIITHNTVCLSYPSKKGAMNIRNGLHVTSVT